MKARSCVCCIALAAVLALACRERHEAHVELARPVVVEAVTVRDVEDRIEATGELRAKDQAAIAAEVAGRITDVLALEGDRVEEGQVLLRIDPEKRQLELESSRAGLTEAETSLREQEREHARVQRLHEEGISSQAALDKATTALELARSRLAAARARLGVTRRALEDAEVRAPFAGLVARREVSRGEFVGVGEVLFEIVALDPVEVEFPLPERDSARVATGQGVAVSVSPWPDEVFQGVVTVVSPTIDPRTRTLRVKAEIPNPAGRLRPGLFARAHLGVARREGVLLVPEPAVLLRAEGQIVYVVGRDDIARRIPVETGIHHGGMVEVLSGVAAGDLVIVRGHASLSDGAPVSRRKPDGQEEHSRMNVAADGEGTETHLQ